MALERETFLPAFTFLGIFLIILGIILLLIPLIIKLGIRIEEVHPLILIGKRLDGIYVGTSPILIIILLIIYLVIFLLRR